MNKICVGLLTGLAIGLLFAPNKGSQTRRKISDALDEFWASFSNEVEDVYESGSDLGEKHRGS